MKNINVWQPYLHPHRPRGKITPYGLVLAVNPVSNPSPFDISYLDIPIYPPQARSTCPALAVSLSSISGQSDCPLISVHC